MEKIGLVLEGGALRGLFSAGVLDFFLEKEIDFPYVVGVSAGSCNALDFVSKQIERTKKAMIQNDYAWYYGLKEFKSSNKLINYNKVFHEYPYKQYPFDFDTYFASKTVNDIVVTNCISGKAEYLRETSNPVRLCSMCEASSSMPILTPMITIDGIPYLDGGITDSIPFRHAFDEGCDRCVVVLTRKQGTTPSSLNPAEKKAIEKLYKEYPNLILAMGKRQQMYKEQIRQLEQLEKEGKVFIIRPKVANIKRLEKDPIKLECLYEHGYMQARSRYNDLLQFLEKE